MLAETAAVDSARPAGTPERPARAGEFARLSDDGRRDGDPLRDGTVRGELPEGLADVGRPVGSSNWVLAAFGLAADWNRMRNTRWREPERIAVRQILVIGLRSWLIPRWADSITSGFPPASIR